MKIFRIALPLLILLALLLSVVPIYGTANPDSPPSVPAAYVYHNLIETGDELFIWEANIPYVVIPTTSVTATFIWRLIALDGVTMLGSTVGYAYHESGYGYNVYSMYFSAADVTALGIVWNTGYTLRLSGNPTVFVTPPIYDYLNPFVYTSLTTSADNQAELAAKIMLLASNLDTNWSLVGTALSLVSETETGSKLSTEGQAVFRGCVYGLQAMAPDVFPETIVQINAPDRAWNSTYTSNLENQYAGSWVETARNASIAFLGTGWDLTGLIILLVLCGALFFGNISLTNNIWDAVIDICFVAIIATRLGIIGLAVTILFAAISLIYIATKIWRSIPGT